CSGAAATHHDRCSANAPLAFELLHELSDLDNGEVGQVIDDLVLGDLGHVGCSLLMRSARGLLCHDPSSGSKDLKTLLVFIEKNRFCWGGSLGRAAHAAARAPAPRWRVSLRPCAAWRSSGAGSSWRVPRATEPVT